MSTPDPEPTASENKIANREFFDKNARKYNDHPTAIKVARKIGIEFTKAYAFDEEKTVAMDFACGTGLISQVIAPECKMLIGVDISQGSVEIYNERVANQGIPSEEMRAVCRDLVGAEDELDGIKFDVIVCAQAYHHFVDIGAVTKILVSHLKPDGKLMIADIIYDESQTSSVHHHPSSNSHPHLPPSATHTTSEEQGDVDIALPMPGVHVVAHKGGFKREAIEAVFNAANLREFDWRVAGEFGPIHGGKTPVQLFIASGTR